TATYEQMEQEVLAFGKEIDRLERQSLMDLELSKATNAAIVGQPYKEKDDATKTGFASNAYKESMLTALRSNFRRVDNVLQEGVDTDGGYLVPTEYDNRLIQGLEEENIMRKL